MNDQIIATITKPPAAERFHAISFAEWLAEGEEITQQTVIASNAALLIDRVTTAAGRVRWRVRAGPLGEDVLVTVTVTTNVERKEPVFVIYRIRQPQGAA